MLFDMNLKFIFVSSLDLHCSAMPTEMTERSLQLRGTTVITAAEKKYTIKSSSGFAHL